MRQEKIMDAIQELPDAMLAETDRARSALRQGTEGIFGKRVRARRVYVKSIMAAACIVLAAVTGFAFYLQTGKREPRPDLPLLTIRFGRGTGMGYEGYMAHDVSELVSANPWKESMKIDTLPVYKNTLEMEGMLPKGGTDRERMGEILEEICSRFQIDPEGLEIHEQEDYGEITRISVETEKLEISVGFDMTATVSFKQLQTLPEEYHFTNHSAYEEVVAAGNYLMKEYRDVIKMEDPRMNVSGGGYNSSGEQSFELKFFEGGEKIEDQIVRYHFQTVRFYGAISETESGFRTVRFWFQDLSQKIGDYPILTVKEARKLLEKGEYFTSVPWEMPGRKYVKKVELVYRTGPMEDYFLPYYRFLVELPEEKEPEELEESGFKDYGAYYVPAVERSYIQDISVYDGGFN